MTLTASPQITTLTSKGQIAIPASLREEFGLKAGDKLVFSAAANGLLLKKATPLDYAWHHGLENTVQEWHSAEDEVYNAL